MQSNPMTPEEPHLFFAEISLDISRGEHALALQRLAPLSSHFEGSYLFTLLLARAHKGTGNLPQAFELLKKCCTIAPANQIAKKELVALYSSLETSRNAKGNPLDCQGEMSDPLTLELEELSAALLHFQPSLESETAEPTRLQSRKSPSPTKKRLKCQLKASLASSASRGR